MTHLESFQIRTSTLFSVVLVDDQYGVVIHLEEPMISSEQVHRPGREKKCTSSEVWTLNKTSISTSSSLSFISISDLLFF
jgi:hypothetical protein